MLLALDDAKVYVGYMVIFEFVKSENMLCFVFAFSALHELKKPHTHTHSNRQFWLHFAGLSKVYLRSLGTFQTLQRNSSSLVCWRRSGKGFLILMTCMFDCLCQGLGSRRSLSFGHKYENKWLLKWCMFLRIVCSSGTLLFKNCWDKDRIHIQALIL